MVRCSPHMKKLYGEQLRREAGFQKVRPLPYIPLHLFDRS